MAKNSVVQNPQNHNPRNNSAERLAWLQATRDHIEQVERMLAKDDSPAVKARVLEVGMVWNKEE